MPHRLRRLTALWSSGGPRRRLALLALLFGACLLGLMAADRAADAPGTDGATYDRALAVAADSERFPGGAAGSVVSLPDDWSRSRPRHDGTVWYRVPIGAPQAGADDVLALYIERVCSNVEVWLNARRIYSGGSMAEPVARNCDQPQLVVLPAALLRPEGNLLDLKVRGYPWRRVASHDRVGGLSALRVGPLAGLRRAWQVRQFWNVTAGQIIGLTLGLFGMVSIGMGSVAGAVGRGSSQLFYFGGLAIAWAALTAPLWLTQLPLANATVELLIASAFAPAAGLAALFLMRQAGIRRRGIDLALLAQCALLPATLALAGPERLYVAAGVWYVLLTLEVLLAMGLHLTLVRQRDAGEFRVMSGVLAALALALGAELALHVRLADGPRPELLRFALPLLVLAVSARLVQLFARGLRAAEAGRLVLEGRFRSATAMIERNLVQLAELRVEQLANRRTLEARIRDATAMIERNFAQLAELRVEQVTEKERKRIAGDLHDDLGAKLLTIVHTTESERISTLAREALEEMRLSVRGLTGKAMRVADALADWRAETVSRLGQAGIEAEWNGPPDEVAQLMSARGYVQTTRILREAVSNIIKHSGATHCKVVCRTGEHAIALVVQDNGRGIPLALDGRLDRGHGMASMKQRAKQLNGQCLVESGPGYGTVIRVTLPL